MLAKVEEQDVQLDVRAVELWHRLTAGWEPPLDVSAHDAMQESLARQSETTGDVATLESAVQHRLRAKQTAAACLAFLCVWAGRPLILAALEDAQMKQLRLYGKSEDAVAQ